MADALTRRLSTWKEIATYIGRDARTAKRYELARGLPVHRMPGEGKSTVYAFADELDEWMRRSSMSEEAAEVAPDDVDIDRAPPAQTAVEPLTPAPERLTRGHRLANRRAGAGLVVLAVLGLGWSAWSELVRARPTHRATPAAAALDLEGRYALERRTPEGLRRAVDAFGRALIRDPADSDAYAGLATAWNLAPQFGGLTPAQAYPQARAAALRAVALAPDSAAAHRVLAFVDFWWSDDPAAAWREFRTALALDPSSAEGRHWYANALGEMGDTRALSEIERAQALAPASTAIVADKGWILIALRRLPEARRVLRQVLDVEPGYAQAHAYMSDLDNLLHDDAGSLAELRIFATLRHDPDELSVVAAGEQALRQGGSVAMLRAMTARQRALFAQGRYPALALAYNEARLGRVDAALARLADAKARREPGSVGMAVNPGLASLRADPRFRAIVASTART